MVPADDPAADRGGVVRDGAVGDCGAALVTEDPAADRGGVVRDRAAADCLAAAPGTVDPAAPLAVLSEIVQPVIVGLPPEQ